MIEVSNEYRMVPFTETRIDNKSDDIFTATYVSSSRMPDNASTLSLCGYGPKPRRDYTGKGTTNTFRSYYAYFRGMNGCLLPDVVKKISNGPRYVDKNNSQIIYQNCMTSSTPFELKMFNPAINDYELVKLCYEYEYQKVEPGTKIPWNSFVRISPFWLRADGTVKYIYESSHFNLDGGTTYNPKVGYFMDYSTTQYYETPIYFLSTDLAWDILNSQWVGQLYLYMRTHTASYTDYNGSWSDDFVSLFDGSDGLARGPFDRLDWSSGSWANASAKLKNIYSRAFLLDTQPIVSKTGSNVELYKCKCVGPNIRIT